MKEFLEKLFSSDFMPHGYCYLWNPGLVWLHVVSDALIALAYFSISVTLIYFIRKRRDLPFHWVFVSFGMFILACGATHTMEVWTLWHGNYWLSGAIKAVTAMASVPTAILLVQLVPQVLVLPRPEAMRLEIDERKRTEQALHEAKNELELRVLEGTAELREANEDLVAEILQRKRAEEALQRSEAYLAEAQRLSHTGSFGWDVSSGEIYWSREAFEIFGYEPTVKITIELIMQRTHPEDRPAVQQLIDRVSRERAEFDFEHRLLMPDGSVKYVRVVGRPSIDERGRFEFVGALTDVTERKQAEEERERLRQAQADLAHVTRVTTMVELTASLAHEVNQPIAAAVTNSNTCLRWLSRDPPDVEEARQAASRIVKDARRAADIIKRIRLLFKRGPGQREPVDVNEVIRDVIVLLRNEAYRYSVAIRTELATDLSKVMADRVQLHQVLTNLMLNGIEAMKEVNTARELTIKSEQAENSHVLISVRDTGVGLAPEQADEIFKAFYTTKADGTGMGLPVSRSIIESHGGRLWATANSERGATFHFTLPSKLEGHE
jgi:PAS domain S-box-containing protein